MLSPATIEKIRDAARIEDIVSEFVPLKKSGTNLTACCPFHNERTPSFAVNPARQIFKCFGCGKGGDVIAFLREYKALDYPGALRHLAAKYGIEVEESPNGKPDPEADRRAAMRATAAVLTAHFAMSKKSDDPGNAYWIERGFKPETLDEFQVGYSDGTKPAHVSDEELAALGATNENGNIIFYKRSIIPIHDRHGNPVGWAGRTVEGGKDVAKYINSPETLIYQKSKTLFNLHRAARHIRAAGEIWIVEGYADVMALWQAGIKNAVALCGTALTDRQAQEIRKFNGDRPLRIILALDNETRPGEAGYKESVAKAYYAALQKLVPIGEVRRVEYPKNCKDMADVVHRGIEPAGIEKKDAIIAFVEDRYSKDWRENASPVEKAEFQEQVARLVADVPKDNVRTIYINQVCNLLEMSARDLDRRIKEFRTEKDTEEKNRAANEYRYIKVGDEYYQRIIDYDIFTKSTSVVYQRRKRQELCTEGVAITGIERFNNWLCEPSHTAYRRIIEIEHDGERFRFFNSYQPMPYQPKEFELPAGFLKDPEGFDYEQIPEIRHTARFFKHIFDWKNYRNRYLKIGWDWVTLCYLNPTQQLQGLILVSTEEGTGKSTFINLLLALFGQNATKTEASRIASNFNSIAGGKLLQCIEETKDEKGMIENKLKDFITAREQVIEAKHQDARVVKSFSKFVFASNHEFDLMKVGTETTRFFVMKVHPVESKILDFEEKMFLEIPYLLYFMQKRGVLTPKEDRLWFNPRLLENEALLKLRHASKDQVQQVMEELFSSIFLRCELTDPVIYISSQYLKLLMCVYGGKSYEQKTPVYFQNTATKDMRLVYRAAATKKETIVLEGIHTDTWINQETWKYTKQRTNARFIEVPVWKFCTPADVMENYTEENRNQLIQNLANAAAELSTRYGSAPAEWLETLTSLTISQPEMVVEDMPF